MYKIVKLRYCVILPFTLPGQRVQSDGGQCNFCNKMESELINIHIIHESAPLWYLQLLYCFTTLKGLILWVFSVSLNEELKYFSRCNSGDPWGSMPAFGNPY